MSIDDFEKFKSDFEKIRFPNFFGFTFTENQIKQIKTLSSYIKEQLDNTIDAMRCRVSEESQT